MRDYDMSPNFWFSSMPRLSLFRENTAKELTQKFVIGESLIRDWTIVHSYHAMQGFEGEMITDLRKFFVLAQDIIESEIMVTVEFSMVDNMSGGQIPCFNFILHTKPDADVTTLLAMKLRNEIPIRKTV